MYLLGVHDDHRGKELGMALLAENLARIDALGAAGYLESSNPVNLVRYASVGFEPRDGITIASGDVITTMWRSARALRNHLTGCSYRTTRVQRTDRVAPAETCSRSDRSP